VKTGMVFVLYFLTYNETIMKKSKSLLGAGFISLLFLNSCLKENDFPSPIEKATLDAYELAVNGDSSSILKKYYDSKLNVVDPKDLPAAVLELIKIKYPSFTVKSAFKTDSGLFTLGIKSEKEGVKFLNLKLSENGKVEELSLSNGVSTSNLENKFTNVALNALPVNISTALKAKYPNATVLSAAKNGKSEYVVLLKLSDTKKVYVTLDINAKILSEKAYETPALDLNFNLKDHGLGVLISIAALPVEITKYINAKYPDAKVVYAAFTDNKKYLIGIKTKEGKMLYLAFDTKGNLLESKPEISPVPVSTDHFAYNKLTILQLGQIPTEARNYLSTKQASFKVISVAKTDQGKFIVYLSDASNKRQYVVFGTDGKVLSTKLETKAEIALHMNINSIESSKLNLVDPEKLPSAISSYLKSKVPGYTILGAVQHAENKKYIVYVQVSNTQRKYFYFSVKGDFISDKAESFTGSNGNINIAGSELPKIVTDAVLKKYPNASIEKAQKNADGTYTILIKKTDGKKVELKINPNGVILKESMAS
jgi:hypothetical protein